MPRKVAESKSIAYFNEGHPGAEEGAGYYEVENDDDTESGVTIGRRVEWVKSNPDPEGEPADPDNNEGHFAYAEQRDEE